MNAEPLLNRIAKVFAEHRLETVMVGNAAAALHGAPVTTMGIDFMFRKTPVNMKKLKSVARSLRAVILKPYYPVSDLFAEVMTTREYSSTSCHGSTASIRSRACARGQLRCNSANTR